MKQISTSVLISINSIILFIAAAISSTGQSFHAGGYQSIAICPDSTVATWGSNDNGQLGNGLSTDSSVPISLNSITNVIAVSSGYSYYLALTESGEVWSWGTNQNGELGNNSNTNSNTPVQINGLSNITDIAGGFNQSIALKSDGTVWVWGNGSDGAMGNSTYNSWNIPLQVPNLNDVTDIAGGNNFFVVLKSDSTVWTWGNNSFGSLGIGSFALNSSVPVQITSLSEIVAIDAGADHGISLDSEGRVWCWGYNYAGQLGNGSLADSNVPVQVGNLSGIVGIAAGGNASFALTSTGTVLAWGDNFVGQLGNGTAMPYSENPVAVVLLNGVEKIEAGLAHVLALKSNGTLWAWGYNSSGQLGIGNTTDGNFPQQVLGLCEPVSDIKENTNSIELFAYPNPTNGLTSISSNEIIHSIAVFDYLGHMIFSTNKNSMSAQIDLTEFSSGIYFIKATTINEEKSIMVLKD
jgi:alpha-tubulin suppressor-like RCC1 family protein